MSEEIEDAQLVDENQSTTQVLTIPTEEDKPKLPVVLDKESAIKVINTEFNKYNVEIADTKDKDNYNKVVEGLKILKNSRIAWSNSMDQNIFGPAKTWFDTFKTEYTAVVEEFKVKEGLLRTKKNDIDTKKKEEKEEAERKKTLALGKRIEAIVELGGKSDGSKYTFAYDLTLDVTISTLKDLDDAKWEETLAEIKSAFEKEKTRLANEKKIADDLAAANLSEAQKLNEKRTLLRRKELKIEGFTGGNGLDYINETMCVITEEQILNLEDEEWDLEILKSSDSYVPEKKVSSGGGGGSLARPKTTAPEVTPVVVEADDDDVQFPWANNEASETIEEPAAEEPKISEELGIKQRTLTFTKNQPFIEFAMGKGFAIQLFPSDDKEEIYSLLAENTLAGDGDVNETLSFVLVKK